MACVYGVEQSCIDCRMCSDKKERYSLEQIVDAITRADDSVLHAIQYKDRDMLEDVLRDNLH